LVGELVSFAPDVVVVNGTPGLAALQDMTRTIPVVFVVVVDPVGAGYVQSLARPGGNITGFLSFEPEIGGKWLELLRSRQGFAGSLVFWTRASKDLPQCGARSKFWGHGWGWR
jgi:hypothetical protein